MGENLISMVLWPEIEKYRATPDKDDSECKQPVFAGLPVARPNRGDPQYPPLAAPCGADDLLQQRGCAADFRHAKEHQRRVRARLEAGVRVVDVDLVFAEPRSRPRQLAPPVGKR